jgi:hypothetical protein
LKVNEWYKALAVMLDDQRVPFAVEQSPSLLKRLFGSNLSSLTLIDVIIL